MCYIRKRNNESISRESTIYDLIGDLQCRDDHVSREKLFLGKNCFLSAWIELYFFLLVFFLILFSHSCSDLLGASLAGRITRTFFATFSMTERATRLRNKENCL